MTKQNKRCTFDPKTYLGQAIGMFHCPVCGEMVIAGADHPDYSLLYDQDDDDDGTNYYGETV